LTKKKQLWLIAGIIKHFYFDKRQLFFKN
jgi:hypothetical protein